MTEASGKDMQPFFARWVYGSDEPQARESGRAPDR
jgi:hypothetical protein